MDTNVSFFSIGMGVNGPDAGIASNEDLVRIPLAHEIGA
jgi:hypothetical protein